MEEKQSAQLRRSRKIINISHSGLLTQGKNNSSIYTPVKQNGDTKSGTKPMTAFTSILTTCGYPAYDPDDRQL